MKKFNTCSDTFYFLFCVGRSQTIYIVHVLLMIWVSCSYEDRELLQTTRYWSKLLTQFQLRFEQI